MAEKEKHRNQQSGTQSEQHSSQSKEPARRGNNPQTNLARRERAAPLSRTGNRSLRSYSDEIDQLFEDFMDFAGFHRGFPTLFSRRGLIPKGFDEATKGIWFPQIETFERGGQIVVRADLPGLNRDDVKIDIMDDSLIIQGERRQEHEEGEEGFYRSERSYGSFYRSIPLPEGVNDEEIKASFRDGVLEVTMPAPERQPRGRRIEIGEGAASEEKPRSKARSSGES